MTRYLVVTPEYEVYSATQMDPPEYGSDAIEIEAESKRDAKLLAVKMWRQQRGRTYIKWYCDECPYTQLKVFEVDQSASEAEFDLSGLDL